MTEIPELLVMVAVAIGLGFAGGIIGKVAPHRRNGNGIAALKAHIAEDEAQFERIGRRLADGDRLFKIVRGDQCAVAALLVEGDRERQAKLKFARPDFFEECVAPRLADFRREQEHRGRHR